MCFPLLSLRAGGGSDGDRDSATGATLKGKRRRLCLTEARGMEWDLLFLLSRSNLYDSAAKNIFHLKHSAPWGPSEI